MKKLLGVFVLLFTLTYCGSGEKDVCIKLCKETFPNNEVFIKSLLHIYPYIDSNGNCSCIVLVPVLKKQGERK